MAPGRRSVLRAVATVGLGAVGGCASADRDQPGDTPTATPLPVETSRPTETPTGTDRHVDEDYYPEPTAVAEPSAAVSLAAIGGDESPVEYDVSVIQPVATTETPPLLAVEATNASGRRLGVGETRAMQFWAARAGETHELVLLPAAGGGGIGYLDGGPSGEGSCWHLDSRVVQSTEYRFQTLDPGESLGSEVEVWWHGPVDVCFPTGSFAFAVTYDVWPPGVETEPGDGDRYRFGFTVDVEPP